MMSMKKIWIVCIFLLTIVCFVVIPFLIWRSGDDSENSVQTNLSNATTSRKVTARTTVTTTSRTTATTTSRTTDTTTTTATTTDPTRYLSLGCSESNVFGVYNTSAGGDSVASSPGYDVGTYPSGEAPYYGCDENTETKSLNFGRCSPENSSTDCGLNSGFYVTHAGNTSLVIGLRMCTGNDMPDRDPINVTLEGSNQIASNLVLGSSWTLIYLGSCGLEIDPGRTICGNVMLFPNTLTFNSYRLLVTEKRGVENSVQFSEIKLAID